MCEIPKIVLNSGKKIPVLGVGTFKAQPNVVKQFLCLFFCESFVELLKMPSQADIDILIVLNVIKIRKKLEKRCLKFLVREQ
jgi:hypothetical protein